MSTTVHPTHTSVPTTSRATSSHPTPETSYANGHHHHHHHHDAGPGHQSGPTPVAKKGKQRKVADNSEASKLIAAKISQLELDAAGEKDQEAEIGGLSSFGLHVSKKSLERGRLQTATLYRVYRASESESVREPPVQISV